MPADLVQYECIVGPTGAPGPRREFRRGAEKIALKIEPRYLFTSAEALIACACEGLGIARAAALMCKKELGSGQLVPLLPDCALAPVEIHAVFPEGRVASQKVRLFTDFLSGVLADTAQSHQLQRSFDACETGRPACWNKACELRGRSASGWRWVSPLNVLQFPDLETTPGSERA